MGRSVLSKILVPALLAETQIILCPAILLLSEVKLPPLILLYSIGSTKYFLMAGQLIRLSGNMFYNWFHGGQTSSRGASFQEDGQNIEEPSLRQRQVTDKADLKASRLKSWREFPGSPVVRTWQLHCQARVQPLVGELISCQLHHVTKKTQNCGTMGFQSLCVKMPTSIPCCFLWVIFRPRSVGIEEVQPWE